MIELTFTIKTNSVNEALDALTEIYLRTENEELQKQCEEYREKLASGAGENQGNKNVPHGTRQPILHDDADKERSDENNDPECINLGDT